MSRIFAVIRRDFVHVRGNVIALLVSVGLAFMPALYAWFNIAGGWDPYGNTGQVKVALANSDEGVEGSVIPFRVNVGERVVSSLTGSTKIGYVVTSENDAVDGVASGKYYAAVVIPKDFSANLLSVLSANPTHPQLDYYVNEKRNAIASIVTGKVSGSVQTMIDEGFTEAVSEAATDLMDDLSGLVNDDSVLALASNLEGSLDRSSRALRRSAGDIAAYRGVLASMRDVTEASDAVLGNNSLSIDAAGRLTEAADGVRQFDSKVTSAKDATTAAIDRATGSVADVEAAFDHAFATADGDTEKLLDALGKAEDVALAARNGWDGKPGLQDLYDRLDALEAKTRRFSEVVREFGESGPIVEGADRIDARVAEAKGRVGATIGRLDSLIETTEKTMGDIRESRTDVGTARDELKQRAAQAREGIDSVRADFDDKLSGTLGEMADAIGAAAGDAAGVSSDIKAEVGKISPLLGDASSGIAGLEKTLGEAEGKLNGAADKIDTLHGKVTDALSSGDVELVRTIFAADPTALVDFFASPVALDRTAIYPIENNGSAMTPYYTTMALWVGGTLLGILFYASLSKRAIEETGARPHHAYFGRLAFFLAVGACQSTILLLGDLFFLRVQCANPLQFMLTGWLASFVFINIIYSLSTSFGDVGKAIGVLFMVIQVAGSGGTFPVEMLPKVFQSLYSFLPFVYSENAFRAAMFGTYGNDWLVSMGTLAAYLVPALLLGLVLRKPLVPVNEWMEEKLEETKLM